MSLQSSKSNQRSRQRSLKPLAKRRLLVQNLEPRHLLAVDGFRIDLSGAGSVDLLDGNGGGAVQAIYAGGNPGIGGGVTITTSNVPGQNNELPIAGADTANANEDGPAIAIDSADLLLNDSDPDSSGTMSVVAVTASSAGGSVSIDAPGGMITYDPNGSFENLALGQTTIDVFQYTLDDGANGRSQGDVSVTITGVNDAPTISGTAAVTVNEGTTATNTGTFGDVDDGAVVNLSADAGSVVDNNNGTWSWSLATTDDAAPQTVTITATDNQNVATDFTFTLTINNVAPIVSLAGDATVGEGATFALNLGAVTDPGDDTVTGYAIDWGDGNTTDPATTGDNTHTYLDGPATHTITVTTTDEDGSHATSTHVVSVTNTNPVLGVDNAAVLVAEGSTANNTGTYSDVVADTVTLSVDVGMIVDNNNGTWSWSHTPADGPNDSQTVTVTATDNDGGVTTETFSMTVTNVAPTVAADNATVTVDEGQTATNTGTFGDVGADTVTLSADVGTVTPGAGGTWSWTLDTTDGPDQSQTVTITATDSDNTTSQATFALTVNNVAPVATTKSFEVIGNIGVTLPTSFFLGGATDPGDDVMLFDSLDDTNITKGTLTDNGNDTFTYIPNVGESGSDTFEFTIEDSDGAVHTQTTTINIGPNLWVIDNSEVTNGNGTIASPFNSFASVNDIGSDVDGPGDIIFVVGTGTSYDTSQGVGDNIGFAFEDNQFLVGSGIPGMTLEAFLASEGVTIPTGTLTLPATDGISPFITSTTGHVSTAANSTTVGGVTLDPQNSAGITGDGVQDLVVRFTIIVTSGGSGDNEGIQLHNVTGTVTLSDVEIESEDGQTNTGTAIQINGGTATFDFDNVDINQDGGQLIEILNTIGAAITFDENSDLTLTGSDEAAVVIQDNTGGTVQLNNDGFSADTSATVTFQITGNTGQSVTTPVNDAPTFDLSSSVNIDEDAGSQSIVIATNISPGPDASEASQTVMFINLTNDNPSLFGSGQDQPYVAADGTLTFRPADNASGQAILTVQALDSGGNLDGGTDISEVQTFTINVAPVNDAPSFAIASDPATVAEDAGSQTVAAFASDISAGPADESSQTLTFAVTNNTNPDLFAVAPAISADGTLTYTPADDVTGTATISVTLSDDGGTNDGGVDTSSVQTFVVNVSPPINDAPTFALGNLPGSVLEDAGPQSFAGVLDQITAGAANESSQSLTFNIAVDDTSLFSVQPAIDASGTLTFTPNADAHGTANLTVTLSDDGGTDNGGVDTSVNTETIAITIDPVNDAPTFTLGSIPSIIEDAGMQSVSSMVTAISAGPANESAQTTTAQITGNTNAALFVVAPAIDSSGNLTYTPADNAFGTATITVSVSDDGGTNNGGVDTTEQMFDIVVSSVNDLPVISGVVDANIDEGVEHTFTATATDVETDNSALMFSLGGNAPAGATISDAGAFAWTPSETQGPDTFTFDIIVSDGTDTASQNITLAVAEANNPPVLATVGNHTINETEAFTLTVTASDTDLPADTLMFSVDGNAPTGLLVTNTGVLTWMPAEDQGGLDHVFAVEVSDGTATVSETITLTVNNVNDAPVMAAIGDQSTDEGVTLSFSVNVTDADLPADTLAYSLGSTAPAAASIDANGDFAWTPTFEDAGSYTFDVSVFDGTETVSESITVTVNDAVFVSTAQAELTIALAEERDNERDAEWFTHFEMRLQDADFDSSSAVYLMLPGETDYVEADVFIENVDHDDNPATADVASAEISMELSQGSFTDAEYESLVDGDWTILVDYDGDFDPDNPIDDFDDAKFTVDFDFDAAEAALAAAPMTVLVDSFDGSDVAGVPTDWVLVGPGTLSVANSDVSFQDIIGDDESPAIRSSTSFNPAGKETTMNASVNSISAFDEAMFGVAPENLEALILLRIERTSDTMASVFIDVDNEYDEESLLLTDALAYDGGAIDLSLTFDGDSFHASAGDFTSDEFYFEDEFSEFLPSDLGDTVYPILATVSDENLEAGETAGNAGLVVFDSVEIITQGGAARPTITSPLETTLFNPVTVTWDVQPGTTTGINVDIFDENWIELYYEEVGGTVREHLTASLPTDEALIAQVTTINEDTSFAGQPQTVAGFADVPWSPLDGTAPPTGWSAVNDITGSVHFVDFEIEEPEFTAETEPFASFEIGLDRISPPGQATTVGAYLDLEVNEDQIVSDSVITITHDGNALSYMIDGQTKTDLHAGGGYASFEFDPENGQTDDEFITSLGGDYLVEIDYDGDDSVDQSFTVAIDASGLSSTSFLAAPTIISPANETTITDSRDITLTWNSVTGVDRYVAGVLDFADQYVDTSLTTATLSGMPTGTEEPLTAYVGSQKILDIITITGGVDIDSEFVIGNYGGIHIDITPTFVDVDAEFSFGSFSGGADIIGGVDFDFTLLGEDAKFNADYFATDEQDGLSNLAGDEDAIEYFFESVNPTGEIYQAWDTRLLDTTGQTDLDAFAFAEMTFAYDDALINQWWSTETNTQIEQNLYLYQFDTDNQEWSALRLTDRDTDENTLTVRVEEMSLILLGHDAGGAGIEDLHNDLAAEVSFDLVDAATADGSETFLGLDIGIETDLNRSGEDTKVSYRAPNESSFTTQTGGWNFFRFEIEAGMDDFETFVSSIDGIYEFQIDFDGDNQPDETFSVDLDTDDLTIDDFADSPAITSPTPDQTITDRTPTIVWEDDSVDFWKVAVSDDVADLFDTEFEDGITSADSDLLPTNRDLSLAVFGGVDADDLVEQTLGTDVIDAIFTLSRGKALSFDISPTFQSVSAISPNGSIDGGSSSVGGVDYSITGLNESGQLLVEYQPIDSLQPQLASASGGGQTAVAAAAGLFHPLGDGFDTWRFDAKDDSDGSLDFTEIELTLGYDPASYTPGTITAYQWDDFNDTWQTAMLLSHDTVNHTITIKTSLQANIVLARAV